MRSQESQAKRKPAQALQRQAGEVKTLGKEMTTYRIPTTAGNLQEKRLPADVHATRTQTSWILAKADTAGLSYFDMCAVLGKTEPEMQRLQDGLNDWSVGEMATVARLLKLPTVSVYCVWVDALNEAEREAGVHDGNH